MWRPRRHRTVGELSRAVGFWQRLDGEDKIGYVIHASQPMPQDPAAGLTHVSESGWTRLKIPFFVLILLRMLLNCSVVCSTLVIAFKDEEMEFVGGSHRTVLNNEGVKICEQNWNISSNSDGCIISKVARYDAFRFITVVEAVMMIPLFLTVSVLFLLFLCGMKNLPVDRPWFFMYAPRMIASLSGMFWLEFGTFRRFESLILRGEGRMWSHLFFFSVQPSSMRSNPHGIHFSILGHRISSDEGGCIGCCYKVTMALIYVALFLISFQALLIKMTSLHFATIVGFADWNFSHWILFLGFVNQTAGAVTIEEVELSRLLLFIYGGSDAVWDSDECVAVCEFMSLVAEKTVFGKIGKVSGSFAAISVLGSFDANMMQRLVLSPNREHRIKGAKHHREALFRQLNASDEPIKFMEELEAAQKLHRAGNTDEGARKLEEAKRRRISFLTKHRDALLERRKVAKDKIDTSLAATLQLAAEVQDCIEDVDYMEFSDEASDFELESEYSNESEYSEPLIPADLTDNL